MIIIANTKDKVLVKACLPVMAIVILSTLISRQTRADCESLNTYHGDARIQITNVEPVPNSRTHLKVRISIASSVDAHLLTSQKDPGRVAVELLDSPFFKGEHDTVLRCEHDVCGRLRAIDFSSKVVLAQANLYVDCPDTGVAVNEVRIQFAEVASVGKIAHEPLIFVRNR
jgi:hypothetical protein